MQRETLHEISLKMDFPFGDFWKNFPAFGMWKRENGEQTEVYLTGHRKTLADFMGGKLGENPSGLPQTELVMESDKVHYLGKLPGV